MPMPESRVFHPLDIHARVLKCMLGSRIFLHVLCVLGEFLACTPRKYTSSVRMLQRQMKACKAEVSKDNIGRQPRETVRSSKPRPNSCSICATKSLWHWHRLDRNRFRCISMQHFSHSRSCQVQFIFHLTSGQKVPIFMDLLCHKPFSLF